jgi:hypothetical protein
MCKTINEDPESSQARYSVFKDRIGLTLALSTHKEIPRRQTPS